MDHIGGRLRAIERNIEILGKDLITQYGFTMVPNFILDHKEISVGGKLYYAMLLKYARDKDECFPGQATLARDIGASERSVRSYQKELEEAGYLKVIHRGLGKTSIYQIDLRVQRKGKLAGKRSAAPDRQNLPV